MGNFASSEISTALLAEDFEPTLAAARGGNSDAFSRLTEPYRPELRAHCYRMLGSLEDAEDLVQETFLRAWRRLETYQGRASFRAWLYKIATNASLDALEHLPRRVLSLEAEHSEGVLAAESEPAWIEPFPDLWLSATSASPEARYDASESISLAFLVALQILPPRQRTVLILADVLDWAVAEIADVLGISVSATTSLLRRARVTMKERNQSGKLCRSKVGVPADGQTRQLLDQYARAWESADLDGIIALLAGDAIFPMPPMLPDILNKQAMVALYKDVILSGDARGRYRLVPIHANGQPGFAFYRLNEHTQRHEAFALQELTIENGQVVNATTFGFPALFPYFNLPAQL